MDKKTLKRFLPVILFIAIFITGVVIAYNMLNKPRKLKILAPADLNPELVDSSKSNVTRMHRVGDFSLINQNGEKVTPETFEGKVYVADFFFTTCPNICPKMTKQMHRASKAFEDDDRVMFLSHTVQPEVDSVEVLAEYAKEYNVNDDNWMLVTGDKKQIYELARKSYFAATTEGSGGPDDFIHTENFVLVDREKRLRGFYDGTSTEDVDRMINEIQILLEEYDEK